MQPMLYDLESYISCVSFLIGKCIASQSKSTFFSISASSLTSKWVRCVSANLF